MVAAEVRSQTLKYFFREGVPTKKKKRGKERPRDPISEEGRNGETDGHSVFHYLVGAGGREKKKGDRRGGGVSLG